MENTKMDLFYNAVALSYIAKNVERKADFNSVLKNAGLESVDSLLEMSGNDFLKTNAVMTIADAGFGKEFVEEKIVMSELLERVQNSDSLLSRVSIRNMLGKKIGIPTRGAPARMVPGSDNNLDPTGVAPVGQVGIARTAEVELEAKSIILTIGYNDSLAEDSLIEIAQYVMQELEFAFVRTMHNIILNGDITTGVNVNINIITGDTATLVANGEHDVLLFDGARKIGFTAPVAGASARDIDAGGALTLVHCRSARKGMGIKGLSPKDLVWVVDQDAYNSILGLSQLETIEKFGDAATIKNGVITAIDAIPVVAREELLLALASGKQSATPASNVRGTMVLIHLPSLIVGIRKGFEVESQRYASEKKTAVTGSARVAVAFNSVNNTVRPSSPAAIIRNI